MSDHLIAEANRHAKALTDERNNLVVELNLLREWQRETIQNERAHHAERKDAIARAERAEAELKRYTDAVNAQPWATDEPIRVLLDRVTMLWASEKQAKIERGDMLCGCQDQLRAERDWLKTWQDQAETNYVIGEPLAKELRDTEAERDELRAEVEELKAAGGPPFIRSKAIQNLREEVARLNNLLLQADELNEGALFKISETNARAERAEAEIKDRAAMMRDVMRERDAAEISLTAERAIVSRIWVQLGSPTYAQLKGRSIYDLIDEIKTELATERARLDWLLSYDGVDWVLEMHKKRKLFEGEQDNRALLAVAMKEGAK